jgi:hypothetical protein
MRRRLTWLALITTAIVVTVLYHAKNVMATPADGFVGTTLALGRFGEIDVSNKLLLSPGNVWRSSQKTQGLSDVYVCRATYGNREERPAGTHTPAIA